MPLSTIKTDLSVQGHLQASSMTIPAGTVNNAAVAAAADIATSKMVHRHSLIYSQMDGANIADTTGDGYPIFIAKYACTIISVQVQVQDAPTGTGTLDVDVQHANDDPVAATTILTGVVQYDSDQADYEVVDGALAVTALAAEDCLMVVVDATDGDGPGQGLIVRVVVDEQPD